MEPFKDDQSSNNSANSSSDDPLLPIYSGIPVVVAFSAGHSLFDFWVHDGCGVKTVQVIAQNLSKSKNRKKAACRIDTLAVEDLCIARFSGDNRWYRAKILEIDEDKDADADNVLIRFIDYGYCERVPKSQLLSLPEDLARYRPVAVNIGLGDFIISRSLDKKLLMPAFSKFVFEKLIRVTSMNPSNQSDTDLHLHDVKIEVFENGEWFSLAEILENDGLGEKVNVEEKLLDNFLADKSPRIHDGAMNDEEVEVFISHVVDFNHFYVIPVKDWAARSDLQDEINPSSGSQSFEEYSLSLSTRICLAPREPNVLVRAKIEEITEEFRIRVFFIDFGDATEVSFEDLRSIPIATKWLELPQMVYRCCLPILPSAGLWDKDDVDTKILETAKDSLLMFNVRTFGWAQESCANIVELFFADNTSGLTTFLCSREKGELFYDVDLDTRKNRKLEVEVIEDDSKENERDSSEELWRKSSDLDKLSLQMDATLPIDTVTSKELDEQEKPDLQKLPPLHEDKLQQAVPLLNMKEFEFAILRVLNYNKVVIKPMGTDFEMKLVDDINDVLTSVENCQSPPPIGTVIIAEMKEGNWQRGVVKKLLDMQQAVILFVDFEERKTVSIDKLKIASAAVLQNHKLAYTVKLIGVEDNPGLLLDVDFQEEASKWMNDFYILESVSGAIDVVSLRPTGAPEEATLSKRVLDLQVWEWERLWKVGIANDTDLIGAMSREGCKFETNLPVKTKAMKTTLLPVGVKLEGNVGVFSKDGVVVVYNVQLPALIRDQSVLQNQIARYAEKLKLKDGNRVFPVDEQVFLAFIPDVGNLDSFNLRGQESWNRFFRMGKMFYSADCEEQYPIQYASKAFFLRNIPPEFTRVSNGRCECRLKDYTPSDEAHEKLLRTFKPKQSIKFTVHSFDEDEFIHIISIEGSS